MSSAASQIHGSSTDGNEASSSLVHASPKPQQNQQLQQSEPSTPAFHQQQSQQQLYPKPHPAVRSLDSPIGDLLSADLHPSRSLPIPTIAPADANPHHSSSSSNSSSNNNNNNFHPRFTLGEGVSEPRPTDVICGRGKMTASHPANRRFRELVDSHKLSYQNSKRRDEKTRITCELVDRLRMEGRFVLFDPNTKLWYEVSEEYAREKVSHSLRSRSSSDQRGTSHTTTSMSLLGTTGSGEADVAVTIAPRTEMNGSLVSGGGTATTMAITAAAIPSSGVGVGSSSHPALVGSSIRNPPTKKNNPPSTTNSIKPKPSGTAPSRKKTGKTTPHKAATPTKAKHSHSQTLSSSSSSSSSSGLDEIVQRLICDQQELLRGMIQKETERFTSAAAMGPPPRPMPLSFRAEANAVSTLTASLPKLGTTQAATAAAMGVGGHLAGAVPPGQTTDVRMGAAAVASVVGSQHVQNRGAGAAARTVNKSTPAPAGAPATVPAI